MTRLLLVTATLLLVPALSHGQTTRAEVLEKERQEKATALHAYEPGKLEKAVLWYEEYDPLRKFAPYNGFYLQYGFRWKPVGSGVGLGAGFRHDLFDRRARIDLETGITFRNYQLLRADFSLPYLADERVELGVHVTYRHNPQEDFFGLGPESLKDDRVTYRVDYRDYQARAIFRPVRVLEASARFGRLDGEIGPGTDSRFPSIEARFNDATAPGLLRQPDYNYAEIGAAVDYRDQADNARAGGYYGVTWRKYNDLDFDRYSVSALELHAQQFFPIFDKKRVIALQARLQRTTPEDGHTVPFYFMPTLGGSTSLRSVTDYRFRDDKVMYLNAEYRWEAFSGLDMALFSDWGSVAGEGEDVSFSDLKHAYGIGFRFNTYKSVWYRIDIGAGGGEGIRYFFKFSKAF
jgi:surface antigen Omp85-like protein